MPKSTQNRTTLFAYMHKIFSSLEAFYLPLFILKQSKFVNVHIFLCKYICFSEKQSIWLLTDNALNCSAESSLGMCCFGPYCTVVKIYSLIVSVYFAMFQFDTHKITFLPLKLSIGSLVLQVFLCKVSGYFRFAGAY